MEGSQDSSPFAFKPPQTPQTPGHSGSPSVEVGLKEGVAGSILVADIHKLLFHILILKEGHSVHLPIQARGVQLPCSFLMAKIASKPSALRPAAPTGPWSQAYGKSRCRRGCCGRKGAPVSQLRALRTSEDSSPRSASVYTAENGPIASILSVSQREGKRR